MSAYAQAIRVARSIVAALVKHHQALNTMKTNLFRAYQEQALDRARSTIKTLTAIALQDAAYQKVLDDLETLSQTSFTGKISKEDLAQRAGPALHRLRAGAKLLRTGDLLTQLKKFPSWGKGDFPLTRDYYCLFGGMDPSREDIAGYLPVLAQQVQVPFDFLESAAGVAAQYDLDYVPPFEMPAPVATGFPTVDPRF
jgi:hypothetical protein